MGCCVREAKQRLAEVRRNIPTLTSSISTTTSGSSKLTCARQYMAGFAYRCDRSIESHNFFGQCTEVSRIKWLGSEQMGRQGKG
jgi:hypothetical protein